MVITQRGTRGRWPRVPLCVMTILFKASVPASCSPISKRHHLSCCLPVDPPCDKFFQFDPVCLYSLKLVTMLSEKDRQNRSYFCPAERKKLIMADTENTSTATTPGGGARTVRAPRGTTISCKGWQQEAALRMLMNNLDPDVAERPDDLIVYGGSGKAARNWAAFDALVDSLRALGHDETLLVQSGKPVGIFRTGAHAPRVLIANALLVPAWATWENFRDLEHRGLTMFGQMTAGSWNYIGSQGIVQGTYETLAAVGRRHFGGSLAGRLFVTAGLGGMGGAQPLAATMNGAAALVVEVDPARIQRR